MRISMDMSATYGANSAKKENSKPGSAPKSRRTCVKPTTPSKTDATSANRR